MLGLLCFTLCILTASSDVNTSDFVLQPSTDKDVSSCIMNIVKEIVEQDDFITDVILLNTGNVLEIHKLHGIRNARYVTRSFSWVRSNVYSRIYVTSCADFETFEDGMKQAMNDSYFNSLANFIIVVENFKDYHLRITRFLVLNNIYNVTILARDDDGVGYAIYTFYSPIHPCNQRERLVAVCHCSHYSKDTFIFPVIEDIRGCSFKFLTHNLFPLIILDDPNDEGVEQRILRYFEQYAGIEIQLIPYSKTDKLGRLIGNFSYTDILHRVWKNEVEGAMGGYFVSIETIGMFSLSYPLMIDKIVAIVARADPLNTWQVLSTKNFSMVALVFSLLIIFSISAYILSLFPAQHADPVRDILIIFGYFLNKITMHKFKPGLPETIITGSLLFTIFIIPYTIQALMCSINTHPIRGFEPKEFDEVRQYYTMVVPSDWIKKGLPKNRKICLSRLGCLKLVRDQKTKPHYTLIGDEFYKAYQWMLADKQCNLRLYQIKEPVTTLMRTMYFRRGSVLLPTYDELLFRVMGGGLVDQHLEEIVHKERLKCKSENNPADVPLNFQDCMVSFYVLIAGFSMATVTFAYEVLVRKT